MKEQSIPYRRLLNLRINAGRLDRPEQVVKQLVAMQAQDYHQALWAIGLRMQASTAADIEQAISDRKIIQTWPMRGTIHFVSPDDVRWLLKLSAARTLAQDKRRLEQLELNQDIIERSKQIMYDALQGNKQISRPLHAAAGGSRDQYDQSAGVSPPMVYCTVWSYLYGAEGRQAANLRLAG